MIKHEIPPIYYKLKDQFNVNWKDIIIAYAPDIYAPRPISKQKEVHEQVHIKRQQEIGVDIWWGMYLDDPQFRLQEELTAYLVEVKWIKDNIATRNERRLLLKRIYGDLSSSMYGSLVSEDEAKDLLT
jgi:hypothetical protein